MNKQTRQIAFEVAEAALMAQGLGLAKTSEVRGRGLNARMTVSSETGSVTVEVQRDRLRIRGVRGSIGFAGDQPVSADFSCENFGSPGAAVAVKVLRKLAWGWRSIFTAAPHGFEAVGPGLQGVYTSGRFVRVQGNHA